MAGKHVVVGAVAVAVLGGGGGYALAASSHASDAGQLSGVTSSGSSTPSSSPSSSGKHGKHGEHGGLEGLKLQLKTLQHAEWVTRDAKTGQDVTHEAVAGTVVSVSSTAITVKAADGFQETMTVGSTTHVFAAPAAKGQKPTAGSISDVKTGNTVLVAGRKSGTATTAEVVLRKAS